MTRSKDESAGENGILLRWNFALIGLYLILLAAAVYNFVKFVIIEGRYKNLHMSMFYSLVIVVIITRCCWISLIIVALFND